MYTYYDKKESVEGDKYLEFGCVEKHTKRAGRGSWNEQAVFPGVRVHSRGRMRGAEGIVLKNLIETTVSASKGKKLLILFDDGCRFIDLSSVIPTNKKPESKEEVERLLVSDAVKKEWEKPLKKVPKGKGLTKKKIQASSSNRRSNRPRRKPPQQTNPCKDSADEMGETEVGSLENALYPVLICKASWPHCRSSYGKQTKPRRRPKSVHAHPQSNMKNPGAQPPPRSF
jgi:hypothetical protein